MPRGDRDCEGLIGNGIGVENPQQNESGDPHLDTTPMSSKPINGGDFTVTGDDTIETLGSPTRDSNHVSNGKVVLETEKVELRKSIHFAGALAILLGNLGGASIFIAPTTILKLTGSPGLAIIMWTAGGLVTWSIAYSICELALLLPGAGGPYIYTLKVFGNIPGNFIHFYT